METKEIVLLLLEGIEREIVELLTENLEKLRLPLLVDTFKSTVEKYFKCLIQSATNVVQY